MKKLVSLLLLFVMLMTMATFSATAEEPIEIIVARSSYPTGWPDSLDKDFIYQQILEKTGVSFKLVALDDYSQTLNLRIINDNAPDMFVINADTMRTYAAQDMLKDLTPYKNNELQCVFDTFGAGTDVPGLYYNDKMYLIPAANYDNNDYYTMYYRKDWADKLQLTPPTTVDELFNFCKTIMEADLDGNGIKDTKAFTGIKMQGLDAIANAYDVALGNYVIVRDGKVTNSLLQPRMKEALAKIREFYDAGLMDSDIMLGNPNVKATTVGGNFGVSVMKWSDLSKGAYVAQAKEINPEIEYGWFGPLTTGEEGATGVYGIKDYEQNTGEKYAISGSISDEKLEAIFKVVQYLCTDEGSKLVYVGQENVHWVYDETGTVKLTERSGETNYTYVYQILGRNDLVYLALKFPEAADVVAYCMDTPRYFMYNKSVVFPDDFYLADLKDYVSMQLTAFVLGERPIEEYDAFIKELYDMYDFQRFMDICTEQLIAMGYAVE